MLFFKPEGDRGKRERLEEAASPGLPALQNLGSKCGRLPGWQVRHTRSEPGSLRGPSEAVRRAQIVAVFTHQV